MRTVVLVRTCVRRQQMAKADMWVLWRWEICGAITCNLEVRSLEGVLLQAFGRGNNNPTIFFAFFLPPRGSLNGAQPAVGLPCLVSPRLRLERRPRWPPLEGTAAGWTPCSLGLVAWATPLASPPWPT